MTKKDEAKLKGKLTCGLKNNIRNLVNFHTAVESLIISFWPKHIAKDLHEKIQKIYVL